MANPANAAMGYFDKIPGILEKYFNPWIDASRGFMEHPGENVNQVGQQFQQSPGYQFAVQQAMQAGQHAAAAGGMSGTPQAQQQQMQMAGQLANQDYYNWMDRALGTQRMGYEGGMGAGTRLGEDIGSVYGNKGQYAYAGQAGENQANQAWWDRIFKGVGAMIPFLMG